MRGSLFKQSHNGHWKQRHFVLTQDDPAHLYCFDAPPPSPTANVSGALYAYPDGVLSLQAAQIQPADDVPQFEVSAPYSHARKKIG